MKKITAIISIMAILLISSTAYANGPIKKLGRGVANTITFAFEVPYRIGQANEDSGPVAACTWGLADGIARSGMRLVVGLYEVMTFPFPIPAYYDPIIEDPEFFFEEGIF